GNSEGFEVLEVHNAEPALVGGVPKQGDSTCTYPIAPVRGAKSRLQPVQGNRRVAEAKDAETIFRVLASTADSALVKARPLAGRTHQIRVHLAACGHPVLGDSLYGNDTPQPLALRAIG